MHHEIAGVLLDVEILQQETRWAVTKVGEIVVGPGEIKSEILIKPLGQIKIPCRDECLDLDGCHVGHGKIPRVECATRRVQTRSGMELPKGGRRFRAGRLHGWRLGWTT